MMQYRVLVYPVEVPGTWWARCFELDYGIQATSPEEAKRVIQEMIPRFIELRAEHGYSEDEVEPYPEDGVAVSEFVRVGSAGEDRHSFTLFGQERLIKIRLTTSQSLCSVGL